MVPSACLVLRLAAPLQSWGGASQFNRRDTLGEPTKSGIVGLLAAAAGRRRQDPIEDLLSLRLGVRVDQPGSLLRDYHTVSDYRGLPLLSSAVASKGTQKPTSPPKHTHVTERFYLQDACFTAALSGPSELLDGLAEAMTRPAFPLALGRRACPPTQPLVLRPPDECAVAEYPVLWAGDPTRVLQSVPWQASEAYRRHRTARLSSVVDLPVIVDDAEGDDVRMDLPSSFDPRSRSFTSRRVTHTWARLPVPGAPEDAPVVHDPFALLGW